MEKKTFTSICIKLLNGATGAALMLFLVVHLAGNLTLFAGNRGRLFNLYAHHLESAGPLVVAAEVALIALFATHVVTAVSVWLAKLRARPVGYAVTASKGGPSHQGLASRSMIITGAILLLFIPIHVAMFKFGPRGVVEIDGREVKDLYLVVLTAFKGPWIAWAYAGVMALLGFHLRHGFWSALQSLGALCPRASAAVYAAGLVFAVLMAGGFLVLPLYLLYFGPDPGTLRIVADAAGQAGGAL